MCKNLQNVRLPSFRSGPFVMSLTSRVNDNDPCLVCLEPLWRPVSFLWKVQCCISKFLHSAANTELNMLFSVEREITALFG